MSDNSVNNKRIAVNTVLLYIRMLFMMVISLYTSRVTLQVLGADDFGIYNVVGGVVVLFSFLTNAMTSSTQRFLNYNLGLKDESKVAYVFNTSMLTHFTIFLLVLFLSETIGLWFVITQLNIPTGREGAAMWVYQMSVLTTLIGIMVIPYRASIIAAERMSIFAYVSILEVVLKLLVVIALPYMSFDNLVMYAILLTLVSFLSLFVYQLECRRKLWFTKFHLVWDKKQYKEMMSFSAWYLFGGMAMVGAKQGTNILINIFYNVAVNAAVGVANQVRSAVFSFVSSFQTALNPQIVKLYASQNMKQLISMLYQSSKFSYYLLLILSFPVILFCKEILALWLVNVPDYTVVFTQLVIVTSFTEALSAPLWTAIGATGKVRKYQILVSLIIFLDVPFVYIAFKLGMSPTMAFIINLVVSILAYIYRLIYIKRYVPYHIDKYIVKVIAPCTIVTLLSLPVPYFIKQYVGTTYNILLLIIITIAITGIVILLFGLNKAEKRLIRQTVVKFIKRTLYYEKSSNS